MKREVDGMPRLGREQEETLRPLTLEEIQRFDSSLIELGANSHTHCILGNESRKRRDWEIRTSIRKVSEWSGRQVRLFSYPNGEPGDFDEDDEGFDEALDEEGDGTPGAQNGRGGGQRR